MKDLLYWALTHGDKFLFWALVFVGGLVSTLILKQIKAGTVRDIVSRALTEVGDAVLAVTQTYVEALKKASADGTLTDAEKAEAKRLAIETVKKNLGPEGLAKLAKIIGVDIDGWLGTKIEAAVGASKGLSSKALTVGIEPVKQADPQ